MHSGAGDPGQGWAQGGTSDHNAGRELRKPRYVVKGAFCLCLLLFHNEAVLDCTGLSQRLFRTGIAGPKVFSPHGCHVSGWFVALPLCCLKGELSYPFAIGVACQSILGPMFHQSRVLVLEVCHSRLTGFLLRHGRHTGVCLNISAPLLVDCSSRRSCARWAPRTSAPSRSSLPAGSSPPAAHESGTRCLRSEKYA